MNYFGKIKRYLYCKITGVRTAGWLDARVKGFYDEIAAGEKPQIKTEIQRQKSLAVLSRAKDMFFESVLKEKRYSFRRPLIILNPYNIAPLSAVILFRTKRPCSLKVTVLGKGGGPDVSYTVRGEKTRHRVCVLGLYPDFKNTVLLELTGKYDNSKEFLKKQKYIIKTPALAKEMRGCVSLRHSFEKTSLEFLYVSGGYSGLSYVFDSKGDIRFAFSKKTKTYGTWALKNGHMLFCENDISNPTYANPHATIFHEVDFMGRVYRTFQVENGVHHFAMEKIGNKGESSILICSTTLDPTCGMENAVLELDRRTGRVIKNFSFNDVFDDAFKTRADWCHVNSLFYLADEDCIIASLRNIHSVVKINWKTLELIWIMGDTKFLSQSKVKDKLLNPLNEIDWFYQQHAAEVIYSDEKEKHILIYDNHVARRRPVEHFVPTEESYLKVYAVNEKDMTVRQIKSFAVDKSIIRSNGYYNKERGRIFSISAFLSPKVDGFMGMISEFDYDSGRLLNEYGLKNDFFMGRPWSFDPDDLCGSLDLDSQVIAGKPIMPVRMDINSAGPIGFDKSVLAPQEFEALIFSNNLIIKQRDHEIRNIYALGKNNLYHLDKSQIQQREKSKFKDSKYYITFPLDDLPPDIYKIYFKTADGLFRLHDTVEIS